MTFYADLHIHSKWSLSTSKDLTLENLAQTAAQKGISLLGTGDFTHPAWLEELKTKLIPAEPGLFQLQDDTIRFMLQVEVSTIYKKENRTRKIHHLIYVPDFETAETFIKKISPFGRLASDGRPTLLLDAKDLLEIVLECHPNAFLIPAHIWAPWFSVLGSKTQFHSIEECFENLSLHIFAVETGLSSDPKMNAKVSSLDRYQLVSNSDAHSLSKIGRNASLFSCPLSFDAIRQALITGIGFEGTLQMYPEEGKYFLDGHRACQFSCTPSVTKKLKNICPHCNKPLTLGVAHRVEELADRKDNVPRPFPKPCTYIIPLKEILAELLHTGAETKKVAKAYDELIATFGPELSLLTQVPLDAFKSNTIPNLYQAIKLMRQGIVKKRPGYDGVYGSILLQL